MYIFGIWLTELLSIPDHVTALTSEFIEIAIQDNIRDLLFVTVLKLWASAPIHNVDAVSIWIPEQELPTIIAATYHMPGHWALTFRFVVTFNSESNPVR